MWSVVHNQSASISWFSAANEPAGFDGKLGIFFLEGGGVMKVS